MIQHNTIQYDTMYDIIRVHRFFSLSIYNFQFVQQKFTYRYRRIPSARVGLIKNFVLLNGVRLNRCPRNVQCLLYPAARIYSHLLAFSKFPVSYILNKTYRIWQRAEGFRLCKYYLFIVSYEQRAVTTMRLCLRTILCIEFDESGLVSRNRNFQYRESYESHNRLTLYSSAFPSCVLPTHNRTPYERNSFTSSVSHCSRFFSSYFFSKVRHFPFPINLHLLPSIFFLWYFNVSVVVVVFS